MLFIGVDVGRPPRTATGVAVMEGDEFNLRLLSHHVVRSVEEVVALIDRASKGKSVFVAVDAPLVAPKKGVRKAEELMSVLFEQYGVVTRRTRKSSPTKEKGELLVKRLEEIRIIHDPRFKAYERSRKCFEVNPQAAMVVLCNLSQALEYRQGPRLTDETRREAFRKYQQLLKGLKDVHLPMSVTYEEVGSLRGKGLDAYGSVLDAVFCAYTAYDAWKHPERCEIVGTIREGYVLTPVFQRGEKQLGAYFSKT